MADEWRKYYDQEGAHNASSEPWFMRHADEDEVTTIDRREANRSGTPQVRLQGTSIQIPLRTGSYRTVPRLDDNITSRASYEARYFFGERLAVPAFHTGTMPIGEMHARFCDAVREFLASNLAGIVVLEIRGNLCSFKLAFTDIDETTCEHCDPRFDLQHLHYPVNLIAQGLGAEFMDTVLVPALRRNRVLHISDINSALCSMMRKAIKAHARQVIERVAGPASHLQLLELLPYPTDNFWDKHLRTGLRPGFRPAAATEDKFEAHWEQRLQNALNSIPGHQCVVRLAHLGRSTAVHNKQLRDNGHPTNFVYG